VWGGHRVGGHGGTERTEAEAGGAIPGGTGAQRACRIGGVPQRGHHGEQGVWGQGAPQIPQPPAQGAGYDAMGPATGTRSACGGEDHQKSWTSAAT
jgi:hypothetical protein